LTATKNLSILILIGIPLINTNKLFNCAAVLNKGKILGIIPKTYIPGYKEFYEPRWFASSFEPHSESINLLGQDVKFSTNLLFIDKNNKNLVVGAEICEDLWMAIPPSSKQALGGATLLCNLSASNVLVAKNEYGRELIKNQSARCIAGYIYVSSGMGESTTDVVFDSDGIICENGQILTESKRFFRENQIIYTEIDVEKLISERIKINTFVNSNEIFQYIEFEGNTNNIIISRSISAHPFIPDDKKNIDTRCEEIFNIQSSGLAKRLESLPNTKAVIGVSGGLDSTLVLLVTVNTFRILNRNVKEIIAVTMPGFGTTNQTYNNAINLCKNLGIDIIEINIKDISNLMFDKVGVEKEKYDVTYENIQARARTYILMSVANKHNGIVIGTGDLSEIALGWSTYNGDHISMYNVNSSIPKTLVKFLIEWVKDTQFDDTTKIILKEIIEQPISPELLPTDGKDFTQKTEDKIGPYELHDFFLYYFLRYGFKFKKILFLSKIAFKSKYDDITIEKWLNVFFKRFFTNQWKRDCVPAGVKVGTIDLSPRGSWRMPADCDFSDFLRS
ncbi:MAG TPA: NAD(+) synthase, partial [Spirochaetota bacterium]|nr:NAD(+) synthase [Spirochaetota bacterium]